MEGIQWRIQRASASSSAGPTRQDRSGRRREVEPELQTLLVDEGGGRSMNGSGKLGLLSLDSASIERETAEG